MRNSYPQIREVGHYVCSTFRLRYDECEPGIIKHLSFTLSGQEQTKRSQRIVRSFDLIFRRKMLANFHNKAFASFCYRQKWVRKKGRQMNTTCSLPRIHHRANITQFYWINRTQSCLHAGDIFMRFIFVICFVHDHFLDIFAVMDALLSNTL